MGHPELTEPVDLCLPSGALNPAAVGWTRRPLHRANLRTGNAVGRAATWGRTKRWEHWCLMSPEHVITITASALNYAGVHQVWVLDRRTGVDVDHGATVPMARDTRMPSSSGAGPVEARAGNLAIAVEPGPEGTRLRAVTPWVRLDALVVRPPGHESLGVVVPWSDRLFQYTVKDVALPVSGRLWVDDEELTLGSPAWAVLSFGRGRWPYAVSWNWGAGSGVVDGVLTGLQLGGRWTDGTGATENALVLGGRIHHIEEDLSWAYDSTNLAAPWFVTGDRVKVRFQPFHERTTTTNLGVVSIRSTQCFGTWDGWLSDDAGTRHRVDGLQGCVEEVSNRW